MRLISDLRRDMLAPLRWLLWSAIKSGSIRPGFITSVNAACTPEELGTLIAGTRIEDLTVSGNLIGVMLTGVKAAA